MTVDVTLADPQIGDRPQVRDLGVSAVSDSRAHHLSAIITGKVVGQNLRYGVPVACREVRQEALRRLACRVFQPWRPRLQFFKAGERGVEVCLVEQFAAAD